MALGKRKRVYGRLGRHARAFTDLDANDMFFPSDPDTTQKAPPVAIKPKSQKEATNTMLSEPSPGQVEDVAGVTGMSRETAVRYLKASGGGQAKHNNTEAALNAFFDQEDISKTETASQWDESAFTADRDGELQALGANTAPPTRPPTPSRSTLHPTSKDQEDDDLAAALAMSQQDLSFQPEGGVIHGDGTETVTFGPAKKEHYDRDQWALVPRAITSGEVVPEANVRDRRNALGDPRVVRHLPDGDYLANFLTICHAIAGAREAMLMRQAVRASYGQDAEWWRGHAVAMPRIVHTESGALVEPDADTHDELLAEVQRVMAVLDASERSYVSPGALAQTEAIREKSPAGTRSGTLLELFMQEWIGAAAAKLGASRGEVASLFATRKATGGEAVDEYLVVDLTTDVPEGEKADLSELTDAMFWNQGTDAYIESPAEVLVMRLRQTRSDAKVLGVEAPAEFYLDKYLKDNMPATMRVRSEIGKGKARIKKIGEIEKRLSTWKHPKKNEVIDAKVLLKHTLGHFSGQNRADVADRDGANGVLATDGTADEEQPANYPDITAKLNKVIASIDTKLTVLAGEKEKTRKAISEMSRHPLPELEGELTHHYTLRGVATKPNITYILRVKDDEDDDEDDEEMLTAQNRDDMTPEGMQWWRIEYDVNASGTAARVEKQKTPDYDVLRAIELEHKEALLIYASDAVNDISVHNAALPPALREFVERDNALFRAELRQADDYTQQQQPPAYDFEAAGIGAQAAVADIPRPSIEPRSSSMDSTRAESGDGVAGGGLYDGEGARPPGYGGGQGPPDWGLGQELKAGHYEHAGDLGEVEEAPVHEIKLDGRGDGEGDGEGEMEMEMVEKGGRDMLGSVLGGEDGGVGETEGGK
ncbi:hypothetical protein LTR08_006075 [Meristemomyces frigidus]|nr:hypothetical protein LTR08_006075 [Meristemomyces frigidus]